MAAKKTGEPKTGRGKDETVFSQKRFKGHMRLIGAGMKQAEAHFHCIRIRKVAAHKPLGQLSVVSTGKWKAAFAVAARPTLSPASSAS
ncbi:hypothetical protein E4U17_005599 [Claviceps sp. LM77 group G4]|nr:hypothetical protein E4U17_005599 [Claviceps sp. LM77 group G4]KAG6082698.1 hypothetical protein E4U33_005425 [Claviceps sp. LM78 group G4]KAG6084372.1 hypothetical protein E4U16_001953 [Claviceps sp. LM84 group G4]